MILPQPLLVFGPRKSGTTLLHNLLDGSDELVMIPGELKLQVIRGRKHNNDEEAIRSYIEKGRLDFRRLVCWKEGQPQARPDFNFDGLDAAQTREVFDVEKYVDHLRNYLNETTSTRNHSPIPPSNDATTNDATANDVVSNGALSIETRTIIERDVAAFLEAIKPRPAAPKFWASKEVSSTPEIALNYWRELFPEGRIVYLVRQPEFVLRSILNERRRRKIFLPIRTIWWHCAEIQHLINYAHQMTFEDAASRPVFLAYEDMTTDTEGEMRRVAREIGIDFNPILTRPTTLGVPMVVRTSSRTTTDVFKQEDNWQRGLAPREVRAIKIYQWFKPLIFRIYRGKETIVPYQTMRQRLTQLNASAQV